MPKSIICLSRKAREYCEEHANSRGYEPPWTTWTASNELRRILCKRIVNDFAAWSIAETEPVLFHAKIDWAHDEPPCASPLSLWLYKGRVYGEDESSDYTEEERKLLVLEEFDKERVQFEKLQAKFSATQSSVRSRSKIPSEVRIFVWQRDSGCCVECGSNENLEYDHIIPFAKGGSNTERNLQLLCANCNRLKSDRIQ